MVNQPITVIGDRNITVNRLSNVGNVINVIVSHPMGASGVSLLRLRLLGLRSFVQASH